MTQFSIIIPSWNNLGYLQLCVSSIRKNSHFSNEIIVYVNEGIDGTLEWIKNETDVKFVHAERNEGICIAVNSCRSLVTSAYMIYMNDDMYVCPDWDLELFNKIKEIGHDRFMISSTLIEPRPVTNANYISIVKDFGDSVENFKEQELLNSFKSLQKEDWSGSSWPPSVVATRIWDVVGGYSIEFSPGMYSDPDFSMKLWRYGIRLFIGLGNSKVYHFQSKSTNKIKKNKGNDTFLMKWGITAKTFYNYYLKMGEPYKNNFNARVSVTFDVSLKNRLKRIYKAMRGS
jgi:glycosyltransferase involved in cell wall biosynthesis